MKIDRGIRLPFAKVPQNKTGGENPCELPLQVDRGNTVGGGIAKGVVNVTCSVDRYLAYLREDNIGWGN
ncbi:hypothetical protein D4T97_010765 [Siminovitchia acidinfaciens]|uniref:Uncharacterized protein n=1 Tax=Siminovitchia acidinfaciens TaxID=2321395 RepID=A0A429XZD6_9BACI|nr:hypothetical protein [Siminovitchia acidinfaciens]RST74154.1 hypothetical protein D4T97_010765 [Siminovitchia acidinfaciens]